MSCSAEQIAEKKRLALERLKAKQTGAAAPAATGTKVQLPHKSKTDLIAENKRLALERLRAKQQNASSKTTLSPSTNSASMFLSSNSFYSEQCQSDVGKTKPLTQNRPKPYADNRPTGSTAKPMTNQPLAAIFQNSVSCSCSLLSSSRFVVKAQKYFEPLIEVFKLIPSRSYGQLYIYIFL